MSTFFANSVLSTGSLIRWLLLGAFLLCSTSNCYILIGEEVQEIFETLKVPDPPDEGPEPSQFQVAMNMLDKHFDVKKNVPYERSIFHQQKQKSGETIDNYVTKLRKLAQYCEYGPNLNDEIRDQVIAKCTSSKLRKRLLQETDLNLEKLQRIGGAMEQSISQK